MSVLGHQTQIHFVRAAILTRYQRVLTGLKSGFSKLDENDLVFDSTVICIGTFSCLMLAAALFLR